MIAAWVATMRPETRRHLLLGQLYFPHDRGPWSAVLFRHWIRHYFEDGCERYVAARHPGKSIDQVRDLMLAENAENRENQQWDGQAGLNYHLVRHLKFNRQQERILINYRHCLVPAMILLARKRIGAVVEIGTGVGFVTYLLSRTADSGTKCYGFDICGDLKGAWDAFYPGFSDHFIAGYAEDALKVVDGAVGPDETVLFISYGTLHNIDLETSHKILEQFAGFRRNVMMLSAEPQDPKHGPAEQPERVRTEFEDSPLYGAMPIYAHNYPTLFRQHFDHVIYASAPMPKDIGIEHSQNAIVSILGLKGDIDLQLDEREAASLYSPRGLVSPL